MIKGKRSGGLCKVNKATKKGVSFKVPYDSLNEKSKIYENVEKFWIAPDVKQSNYQFLNAGSAMAKDMDFCSSRKSIYVLQWYYNDFQTIF